MDGPGSSALEGEALLRQGKILHDVELLRREQGNIGGVFIFPLIFFATYVGHWLGYVNKAILILSGCMTLSGLLIHMATQNYPSKEGKSATILERLLLAATGQSSSAEDSMMDLVTKFRLETENIQQSHLLLINIRKKLQSTGPAAMEAVKLGLVKYALQFVQEKNTLDKRIPIALDIITVIFSRPEACQALCSDETCLRDTIDLLIQSTKEHMKSDEQLDKVIAAEVDKPIERRTDGASSLSTSVNTDIDSHPPQDGVDFDFSDRSEQQLPLPNKHFLKFGHKFILALGMLCADHVVAQTRLGDRGAVALILTLLQTCKTNATLAKWCLWSLIHITFQHPPNKREFFMNGGLRYTMDALQAHTTVLDINQQGLALIATIIAPDATTKMNLAKARETCLANGVFDVLQNAKKQFTGQNDVQTMIKQIFDTLMADWS